MPCSKLQPARHTALGLLGYCGDEVERWPVRPQPKVHCCEMQRVLERLVPVDLWYPVRRTVETMVGHFGETEVEERDSVDTAIWLCFGACGGVGL